MGLVNWQTNPTRPKTMAAKCTWLERRSGDKLTGELSQDKSQELEVKVNLKVKVKAIGRR